MGRWQSTTAFPETLGAKSEWGVARAGKQEREFVGHQSVSSLKKRGVGNLSLVRLFRSWGGPENVGEVCLANFCGTSGLLLKSTPREVPGGPGSVRFGYGLGMERFKFLCKKGFSCISVQFNRKGRFRFRFLENGSGGSGSAFCFGKNGSDGSGFRFRFGS